MTIYSGKHVLLKIEEDGRGFRTVGGMRASQMLLRHQPVDMTSIGSSGWYACLDGSGTRSLRISGQGMASNSDSEEVLRRHVFDGKQARFQLCFGNGMVVEGNFFITHYERIADFYEEEKYRISLTSSGELMVQFDYLKKDG